jgi:hypothetical protein
MAYKARLMKFMSVASRLDRRIIPLGHTGLCGKNVETLPGFLLTEAWK